MPVTTWEWVYEVSDLGRIRSLDRELPFISKHGTPSVMRIKGMIRKPVLLNRYMTVKLQLKERSELHYVHRIVLEAFVGPCPPGMEACHGVGGQLDNRLSNLRWDTLSQNGLDTVRHGNHFQKNKTHCKRNHPLSGNNLRMEGTFRRCKACITERSK